MENSWSVKKLDAAEADQADEFMMDPLNMFVNLPTSKSLTLHHFIFV